MRQQDLRVGNYLTNFIGEVFEVNGETICYWNAQSEFKKPEPIPLNEEFLQRFGFKYIQNERGYIAYITVGYKLVLRWSADMNTWKALMSTERYCDHYLVDVRYVHELQNLYYVLKTEDLILK